MTVLDRFSLAGKTALVTGCKRGIGKDHGYRTGGGGSRHRRRQRDAWSPAAALVENAITKLGRRFTPYCL